MEAMVTIIKKLWGEERVICNNEHYCAKILLVHPGYASSLHYHPVKRETFHVRYGIGLLEVGCGEPIELRRGVTVDIEPGTEHRFRSAATRTLCILEVSTHHDDADVVRLEPSRKL